MSPDSERAEVQRDLAELKREVAESVFDALPEVAVMWGVGLIIIGLCLIHVDLGMAVSGFGSIIFGWWLHKKQQGEATRDAFRDALDDEGGDDG